MSSASASGCARPMRHVPVGMPEAPVVPGRLLAVSDLPVAYRTGGIGTGERHQPAAPYPNRDAGCQARVDETLPRLALIDPGLPTILVSHCPRTREPTRVLRYPVFAQWCGTEHTADWQHR